MSNTQLDTSKATEAIKETRFVEALRLLKLNLEKDPNHIDSLYLAAVSSRYVKNYDDSKKYIEALLMNAPDMGRAYQELGHLSRDNGNEEDAIRHYRQACELTQLYRHVGRPCIITLKRIRISLLRTMHTCR